MSVEFAGSPYHKKVTGAVYNSTCSSMDSISRLKKKSLDIVKKKSNELSDSILTCLEQNEEGDEVSYLIMDRFNRTREKPKRLMKSFNHMLSNYYSTGMNYYNNRNGKDVPVPMRNGDDLTYSGLNRTPAVNNLNGKLEMENNDRFAMKSRMSQDTLVNSDFDLYSQCSESNTTLWESNNAELYKEYYVKPANEKFELVSRSISSILVNEVETVAEKATKTDLRMVITSYNHAEAYELGKNDHLHYYQLPFPWRENKYIIQGYRFYNSNTKLFLSIFNFYGMHNETMNIWTHLVGAIYLSYLSYFDFPNSFIFTNPLIPKATRYIIYIFLFAGIKCMVASVFWHTFNGTTSLRLRPKFCCVDYTGITLLISASIITAEFVTLFDYPKVMLFYMTLSTIAGMCGLYLNWSPKFDSPEARPLRIKFFILLAAVGGLAFSHLIYLESIAHAVRLFTPLTNKSVIWYLVGVFFYGSFIPERFRSDFVVDKAIPSQKQLSTDISIITKENHIHFREKPTKTCHCNDSHAKSLRSLYWVDYYCNSHNIWHLFVLLGVIGHYNAILDVVARKWLLA